MGDFGTKLYTASLQPLENEALFQYYYRLLPRERRRKTDRMRNPVVRREGRKDRRTADRCALRRQKTGSLIWKIIRSFILTCPIAQAGSSASFPKRNAAVTRKKFI